MTDSTDSARELAYQEYINEMTPNGNTRITNLTLCNTGPRAHQHIATQVDLAFQAGWSARADLAPNPMGAVKVKPLVWNMSDRGARWAETECGSYVIFFGSNQRATLSYGAITVTIADVEYDPRGKHCMAFAGEHNAARIRSALEPCDPLADPRVMALVDALESARATILQLTNHRYSEAEGTDADWVGGIDAALAALSPTGGNDGD